MEPEPVAPCSFAPIHRESLSPQMMVLLSEAGGVKTLQLQFQKCRSRPFPQDLVVVPVRVGLSPEGFVAEFRKVEARRQALKGSRARLLQVVQALMQLVRLWMASPQRSARGLRSVLQAHWVHLAG